MVLLRGIVFISILSTFARAESKGGLGKGFFFIEAGAYVNNLKERQNAPEGYASKLSSLKAYLRLHPGFHLGKNWYFEPSFGTMLPTRDGVDGSNSAFESQLALQLSTPVFRFLRFRLGPGLEWVWLMSKSQTIALNNGTTTSNFYTPDRFSSVFLFTATAGLTFRLHDRWLIGVDLYVPQVMNSARRRYNASVTLGFRL